MKLYHGKRIFNRESMTWGEASVFIQEAVTDRPVGDSHPLTHIPYHSPDGFEWGYLGSGPADLALAILADYFQETPELVLAALRSMWTPRSRAAALYQSFKRQFLAGEQGDEWELHSDAIERWLETPSIRTRLCELAREDGELAEVRRLGEEARHAADAAD